MTATFIIGKLYKLNYTYIPTTILVCLNGNNEPGAGYKFYNTRNGSIEYYWSYCIEELLNAS